MGCFLPTVPLRAPGALSGWGSLGQPRPVSCPLEQRAGPGEAPGQRRGVGGEGGHGSCCCGQVQ